MSSLWPRNGETRGSGRNKQIYYNGEWQSPKGEETVIRGDQASVRMATNPDWKGAQRAARRRQRAKSR